MLKIDELFHQHHLLLKVGESIQLSIRLKHCWIYSANMNILECISILNEDPLLSKLIYFKATNVDRILHFIYG